MVTGQSTLSLVGLCLIQALALHTRASAQQADFESCLGSTSPSCRSTGGPLVVLDPSCPHRFFDLNFGYVAWYPLMCVGPIEVAVETKAIWQTLFPLYVEIVPTSPGVSPCLNLPGNVVLVARGIADFCGGWETTRHIDISSIVPVGTQYALRLYFLWHPQGYGPAVNCVRVTSFPQTSAVVPRPWGAVKRLYR